MQALAKLNYKLLYLAWAVLFVLTAVLGLLYPNVEETTAKLPLQLATGAFFLPPWAILVKANQEGNRKHNLVVRNLCIASLAATVILMVANILTVGHSPALGDTLFTVMTVVCAPLVCSNMYIMPLFLWGTLLLGSTSRPAAQ